MWQLIMSYLCPLVSIATLWLLARWPITGNYKWQWPLGLVGSSVLFLWLDWRAFRLKTSLWRRIFSCRGNDFCTFYCLEPAAFDDRLWQEIEVICHLQSCFIEQPPALSAVSVWEVSLVTQRLLCPVWWRQAQIRDFNGPMLGNSTCFVKEA